MPSSDPRNYARFIPKEELGPVSQWRFGAVGSAYTPEQIEQRQAEAQAQHQALLQAEEAAYLRGLNEGRAQAHEEAQRLCDNFMENQGNEIARRTAAQMAGLLQAFEQGLQLSQERLAQSVLDLGCMIARQVLRRELSLDPQAVRHVVVEALQTMATDGKPATVRLHPDDLALLQDGLQQQFPGRALMFVPDASLNPGDCQLESAGAVVDGRLQRRWAHALSGLGLHGPESALNAGDDDAA